jgi:O-antigen/teichoic acid export membrane protein
VAKPETSAALGRRVAIGAGWMMGWRMLARLSGLASTLVLARLLVPADFGLVALAMGFAAAFDALSEIGVQDALVRHPSADRDLYHTAFTLQALRAAATAILLALAAPAAASWFNEPRLLPVLLVLAAVAALAGLDNIATVEFRRALDYRWQVILLGAPRLLSLLVVIPLALATHSYWALVAGTAAARLGQVALGYALHPWRPSPTLARWRELVGFSLWSWAAALANAAWTRSDPVVLGAALGAGELGLYMLAAEVALLPVSELVEPAAEAIFTGAAAAENAGQDAAQLVMPTVATLLAFILPLALAISAAAHEVASVLFGPGWDGAGPVIAIGVWASAFAPLSYVANAVLVARGRLAWKTAALAASSVLRVQVVLICANTGALATVAGGVVAVTAIEALLFAAPLARDGGIGFRNERAGLLRLLAATAAAACMLRATGLGWRPASGMAMLDLVVGTLAGLATILAFGAGMVALWLAAGRPDGAERRALGVIATLLAGVFRKA